MLFFNVHVFLVNLLTCASFKALKNQIAPIAFPPLIAWNTAITDKRHNSSAQPEDIKQFVVACVKTSLTFQLQTNLMKHQKQQADQTVMAVWVDSRCVLCILRRSLWGSGIDRNPAESDFLSTTWQWNRSQTGPFSVDIKWINHEIKNEANKIWWISVLWQGFALRTTVECFYNAWFSVSSENIGSSDWSVIRLLLFWNFVNFLQFFVCRGKIRFKK